MTEDDPTFDLSAKKKKKKKKTPFDLDAALEGNQGNDNQEEEKVSMFNQHHQPCNVLERGERKWG